MIMVMNHAQLQLQSARSAGRTGDAGEGPVGGGQLIQHHGGVRPQAKVQRDRLGATRRSTRSRSSRTGPGVCMCVGGLSPPHVCF